MVRFLPNFSPSEYFPLSETLPTNRRSSSSSSTSDDECETQKRFAQRASRWSSLKDMQLHVPSVSAFVSLILVVLSSTIRCTKFLLPSFVPPVLRRLLRLITRSTPKTNSSTTAITQRPRRSPTAYLDGLRGVAAVIVFLCHFHAIWWEVSRYGYGSPQKTPDDPPNTYWFQLPIIRILHSGRASVTVFFVISGFVLPLKTLSMIYGATSKNTNTGSNGGTNENLNRKVNKGEIFESLSGALFRRPIRLFFPILVSTAIVALFVRIPNFFKVNKPPRLETWLSQLSNWWNATLETFDPFQATQIRGRDDHFENEYNGALWTIPVEYKGSLQIFMLLLAFGGARRWVRVLGIVTAGWWQLTRGDADMTLFCAGLLLAEAHVVRRASSLGSSIWTRRIPNGIRHAITILVFVIALHLMSYPDWHGRKSPGFQTLAAMVPDYYFAEVEYGADIVERMQHYWLSVGSVLFVWALMYSPPVSTVSELWSGWLWSRKASPTACGAELSPIMTGSPGTQNNNTDDGEGLMIEEEPLLQKLFTNDFAQYLGKISYSLYLAHIPVQNHIAWGSFPAARRAWQEGLGAAAAYETLGLQVEAAAMLTEARHAFVWSYLKTLLVDTIVVFWIADLFYRSVDVYSVRIARGVWNWVSRDV